MTNSKFLIRFAEPADIAAIVDFNQRMALETENKLLPAETFSAVRRKRKPERAGGLRKIGNARNGLQNV